jgi:hypothetical protein
MQQFGKKIDLGLFFLKLACQNVPKNVLICLGLAAGLVPRNL